MKDTQIACICFSLDGFVSRFQNVSRVLFLSPCLYWIILHIVSNCPSDCSLPVDEGPLSLSEVLSLISDITCMAPPTPQGFEWTLGNLRVGGVNTAQGQWRQHCWIPFLFGTRTMVTASMFLTQVSFHFFKRYLMVIWTASMSRDPPTPPKTVSSLHSK